MESAKPNSIPSLNKYASSRPAICFLRLLLPPTSISKAFFPGPGNNDQTVIPIDFIKKVPFKIQRYIGSDSIMNIKELVQHRSPPLPGVLDKIETKMSSVLDKIALEMTIVLDKI